MVGVYCLETIESSIVKGLIYDDEYARKVYPHLNEEYFDGIYKVIFQIYSKFFDKYNKAPTMQTVLVKLQNKKLTEDIFNDSITLLEGIYKSRDDKPDTQWLIDESESYCVDKAMFNAMYRCINIAEGKDKNLDKHSIPEILEKALAISFNTSIGSDYFEDWEKRYHYYTNVESRLRFPLEVLNLLSNGGLPKKTLNCLMAGPNVGKSSLMCYLAGEWLKAGKNVVYITLEMSEEAIQERVDANLFDCKTDDLKNPNLDKIWFSNKVNELKQKTVGKFVVKEYPTGSAHAGHFRHFLKELKQKKKFTPDVVIIDYINICSSARYKSYAGLNSYTIVKSIAEELRGLGVEFDVPVLTATQVNREGINNQKPDMTATSDSIGLPQTLDWFVALVSNEDLMKMNRQLAILLKTRYGNKKGISARAMRVDFDYMRYYDVESEVVDDPVLNGTQKPDFKKQSGIPEGIKWD